MEEIKVSKKFRNVCYQIMDGDYDIISELDNFVEYPHQVQAVKAAVAYFDKDYTNAIRLTVDLMPYWEEWHYANVGTEYMTAMAFAAREVGEEANAKMVFQKEQKRLLAEDEDKCKSGRNQRYNYCSIMLDYLDTGRMPKTKNEIEYSVPVDAKSAEEIIISLKLKNNTIADKIKLYTLLCMKGFPEDALEVYEEIKNEKLSEMQHEEAMIRYLFVNQEEKALEVMEKLAGSRMWTVASPTQVRPMNFFTHPMMHRFLRNDENLIRIKKAAFIDNGTVKRK